MAEYRNDDTLSLTGACGEDSRMTSLDDEFEVDENCTVSVSHMCNGVGSCYNCTDEMPAYCEMLLCDDVSSNIDKFIWILCFSMCLILMGIATKSPCIEIFLGSLSRLQALFWLTSVYFVVESVWRHCWLCQWMGRVSGSMFTTKESSYFASVTLN